MFIDGDHVVDYRQRIVTDDDKNIYVIGVPGEAFTFLTLNIFQWLTVISVAISVGSAIYALSLDIPDDPIQDAPQRLRSITGQSNAFAPYASLAVNYGTRRVYPALAALPYTEVIGQEQYLNMLLCVGIGAYDLSDIRIGEQSIDAFDKVDIEQTYVSQGENVDWRIVTDQTVNTELTDPGFEPANFDIEFTTAPTNVERIALDFSFPAGLVHTDGKGNRYAAQIHFKIEYKLAGSPTWLNARSLAWAEQTKGFNLVLGVPTSVPVSDTSIVNLTKSNWPGTYNEAGQPGDGDIPTNDWFMVSDTTNVGFRAGIKFNVPSGQYDIRVTRTLLTARGNNQTTNFLNVPGNLDQWFHTYAQVMVVNTLHSYTQQQAVALPSGVDATFLSVRIQATDQINGVIQNLSVIAKRRLRQWTGSTFTTPQASRSPAWAYMDLLCNPSVNHKAFGFVASANDFIDFDEILAWDQGVITTESLYYDEAVDFKTGIFNSLRRAAGVGWASPTVRDGQFTVVIDDVARTPVQLFTPKNTKNFRAQKTFNPAPHAYKVQFDSDQTENRQDEIVVYDDGYSIANATLFEVVRFPGVTDANQAWKLGRRLIAETRLRPEVFSFDTTIEHLICQRGDTVALQHDVTLWGLHSARVESISNNTPSSGLTTIFVDEPVITEAGKTYGIVHRRTDVTQGDVNQIDVTPSTIPSNENFSWYAPSGSMANVQPGDFVAIGLRTAETQNLVVASVRPKADGGSTITAVDQAPALYTAHTGTIPPYNPNITQPPSLNDLEPSAPVILRVDTHEGMASIQQDGTRVVKATVIIGYTGGSRWALGRELVRYRVKSEGIDDEVGAWQSVEDQTLDGSVVIQGLEQDVTYELQAFIIYDQLGRPSEGSPIFEYTVPGFSRFVPPPALQTVVGVVGGILVTVDISNIFTYDPSNTPDISDLSFLEIYYDTVDNRTAGTGNYFPITLPARPPPDLTVIEQFFAFSTLERRYFWARVYDNQGDVSAWSPASVSSSFFAEPQTSSPTIILSARRNTKVFASPGASPGDIYVHGFDSVGNPADVSGEISYEGQMVEVFSGSIGTSQQIDKGGWLLFETASVAVPADNLVAKTGDNLISKGGDNIVDKGGSPGGATAFMHDGTQNALAGAKRTREGWRYDDGTQWATFTATSTMVVIGTYTALTANNITTVELFGNALGIQNVPLEDSHLVFPDDIQDGAINLRTMFATTLRPPEVVDVLPSLADTDYENGDMIYLTSDGVLYRREGNAPSGKWQRVVDGNQLSPGSITETEIKPLSIGTPLLAANAVNADKLAANSVTAGAIKAGAVGVDQLAANAVVADKIAANEIDSTKIVAGGLQAGAIEVSESSGRALNLDPGFRGSIGKALQSVTQDATVTPPLNSWFSDLSTLSVAQILEMRQPFTGLTPASGDFALYLPQTRTLETERVFNRTPLIVDPQKTYRVSAHFLCNTTTTAIRNTLLAVVFYGNDGSYIPGTTAGTDGWAANGTYHYAHVFKPTNTWQYKELLFGPASGGVNIPSGAFMMRVGVIIESGTGTKHGVLVQDLRIDEAVDSTIITDQAVIARHMQADSITATNAAIADLTVGTIKIQDQAIIEPVTGFRVNPNIPHDTNGIADTWNNAWTEIVDATIVVPSISGTQTLNIKFDGFFRSEFNAGNITNLANQFRVLRDAVEISNTRRETIAQGFESISASNRFANYAGLTITDNPGAGTFTYSVEARNQSTENGFDTDCVGPALTILLTKR